MTKLLVSLLGSALAVVVAATPAGAAEQGIYCLDREPDYVLDVRLHDGLRRCLPTP